MHMVARARPHLLGLTNFTRTSTRPQESVVRTCEREGSQNPSLLCYLTCSSYHCTRTGRTQQSVRRCGWISLRCSCSFAVGSVTPLAVAQKMAAAVADFFYCGRLQLFPVYPTWGSSSETFSVTVSAGTVITVHFFHHQATYVPQQ
jgi:hypothetical protein